MKYRNKNTVFFHSFTKKLFEKKNNQELFSLHNSQVRQILLLEHGIIPTVSDIMVHLPGFILWVQCGRNCWMLIWWQTSPFTLGREIRCCDDISAMQCPAQLHFLQFLCALPAWYASCFPASWETTDGGELKSNTGHYDSIVLTKQWQSPVRVMFSPHSSLFIILPPFCGWQMWRREKSGEDNAKLTLAMTD